MVKVSVILPSLNVVSYIRQCVESVMNQTLQEIEILCVDAGSADGTREILAEYAAFRMQFIDEYSFKKIKFIAMNHIGQHIRISAFCNRCTLLPKV